MSFAIETVPSDGPSAAVLLLTFGGLFLLGLIADLLGRHTPLPRATLLIVCGVAIGPSILDWLPDFTYGWFPILTDIALAMVGFLLGHNLTRRGFEQMGHGVLAMSLGEVLITAVLMFVILVAAGVPPAVALLLAGIAPATAPTATVDIVQEYGAKGHFTDTLLGIVAIDDAWGLLVFTLLLAAAQAISGNSGVLESLQTGGWEIGGALLLGVLLGLPMAYLTGRIRPGQPSQAEALGAVLLCAGLAKWLDVSYLLATMTLGAMVANFAKHHERPFHEIEGLEWPFLILFFLLAGASLHIDMLAAAGILTGAYIVLRIAGRILGTRLGGWLSGADETTRNLIGLALLPQAGVAIGMALLAAQRFPELGEVILPVILGSTVIFEIFGPIATRWTLVRSGDIKGV